MSSSSFQRCFIVALLSFFSRAASDQIPVLGPYKGLTNPSRYCLWWKLFRIMIMAARLKVVLMMIMTIMFMMTMMTMMTMMMLMAIVMRKKALNPKKEAAH